MSPVRAINDTLGFNPKGVLVNGNSLAVSEYRINRVSCSHLPEIIA